MSTTDPSVVAYNPQFATILSPTPTQSIPNLIWFLKSCYRDSDFDLIQQVLLAREYTLAQSNKELSNRIVDLELRHRSVVEELQRAVIGRAEAEEERKQWKRECEAAREERKKGEEERKRGDEERRRRIVKVIGRCKELEAGKRMAEGEVKAKEEEIRVLKAERRDIEKVRVLVERNGRLEKEKREFEKVRSEKEEEIRVLVERNRGLEVEKREFEEVRSEKEEEIRGLVERNLRLEAEKREFEKVRSEKEEEIRGLVERNRQLEAEKRKVENVRIGKEDEIRVVMERCRRLEAEKTEFEKVRIEKEKMVREAEERCKGLVEEKAKVETELEAMRGLMDEKVSRMMKEVNALMVAYTRVGENGHGGGGEKEMQDVGRSPVQKTITNDGKVDDRKGAMSLRKKVVFSPEVSQENSPSVAEKPTPSVPIILSDTDDDDDKMLIQSLKRKRTSSEPANLPSAASSSPQSEKKLVDAPPGFTVMSALRKCEEKFATESKKLSSPMRLDATDGEITSSDSEDEPLGNPVVSQIIASCRKSRMSNVWEQEADLLYAFDRDPELCAKAVCALYRQNLKVRNGSLSIIGSGGFRSSESDVLRVTALAKFLVDSDPENRMKRSASDLKQCDPKGHEDVQRIAKAYSKQFI
ncbi:hypothetical protein AKJ16_DCAP09502 [Drosera capensis]